MGINKATVLVAGIGASIVVSRALGPDGRGAYAVAVSLALILVQLGIGGYQTANPFYVASGRAPAGLIVTNSLWLSGWTGLLLIAVAIGVKLLLPGVVAGLSWTQVLLAAGAVPFMLAMQFLQSVLLGQNRTVAYNVLEMVAALFALVALLLVEAVRGLTVDAALAITAGAYVFGALAMLMCLLDTRPRLLAPDIRLMRRMAGYAARVYVAGLIAFAVVRVDLLLVNGILGAEQAGLYSLAVALKDTVYIMPLIVATNIFPRIAGGAVSSAASAEVFRSVAALYALVCLATAVGAPPIITLLYGEAFADAADLFRWLAPGAFAVGALNIVTYHFAAREFPLKMVGFWAVGLVFNLAINIAFLERYGTYIASLSASLAYVLIFVLHLLIFARELGSYRALVPRPREVVRFVRVALTPSPPDESEPVASMTPRE